MKKHEKETLPVGRCRDKMIGLESLCEEIGKGLVPLSRSISGKKINPENFQNGLVDSLHQFRFQIGDGAGCDSPVVDGTDLVNEQIGIPGQLFTGFDPDAEWLCIVDEIRRQGDDDRGWMSGIQKGLILKNEDGSRFSRLRPFLRVEICHPDRPVLKSRGHVPPR